jgi:ribosome-associated heat shock protein Hsp15
MVMTTAESVRIDKFLWAVRLFKTRSLATEACKKGRVLMDNVEVKSSRTVKAGDVIAVKVPPILKKYEVLCVAEKRMGAKLTSDFIRDITPADDLEMLKLTQIANSMNRQRGLGRPTKKDRRDLDGFFLDGTDDLNDDD